MGRLGLGGNNGTGGLDYGMVSPPPTYRGKYLTDIWTSSKHVNPRYYLLSIDTLPNYFQVSCFLRKSKYFLILG